MNTAQTVFAYVESVALRRGRTAQPRKRVRQSFTPHFEINFGSSRSLAITFEICANGAVMRPLRDSIKSAVPRCKVSCLHFTGQSKTHYRNLLKKNPTHEVNDVTSSYYCTVRIERRENVGAVLATLFDYIRTVARIEGGELLRLPVIPKRLNEPCTPASDEASATVWSIDPK